MRLYPAMFQKDGDYILVTFPDVPEAITQGKDLQEAYAMAYEVLGFALEDYSDYPKPSDVSTLQKAHPDATIVLINIDMTAYLRKYHSQKVRKNVTIPKWLNDLAEENNLNFSQVLTEALKLKLHT